MALTALQAGPLSSSPAARAALTLPAQLSPAPSPTCLLSSFCFLLPSLVSRRSSHRALSLFSQHPSQPILLSADPLLSPTLFRLHIPQTCLVEGRMKTRNPRRSSRLSPVTTTRKKRSKCFPSRPNGLSFLAGHLRPHSLMFRCPEACMRRAYALLTPELRCQ